MKQKLYLLLILGCSLLFSTESIAQFGVSPIYNFHQSADEWDDNINVSNDHIKSNGYGVALNYWFRLKNYRVEFLPEIGFLTGSQDGFLPDDRVIESSWRQISFYANTNIYPLDFEGDCNCPTFGKDGSLFEKGFFIQISPGVGLWNSESDLEGTTISSDAVYFLAGLGAGIDIGVAEYLTITPFVRYSLGFGATWKSSNVQEPTEYQATSRDLLAGINFIYRLDYKKRNRF